MPDITNILLANILAINDISASADVSRNTGNVAFESTISQFTNTTLAAGVNGIVLPIIPVKQLYIKNLDNLKTITVEWTAGILQTITVLNPGDQIILWSGPNSLGISFLRLTASNNDCSVEYFLGG